MPLKPSSNWLSVAFVIVIVNLSMRDILAGGVGHWLSMLENKFWSENIEPPTTNAEPRISSMFNAQALGVASFPTT
jgi:hypothetical protein